MEPHARQRVTAGTVEERRFYGLDALRGVMMLLGIVIHSAMFYTVVEFDVLPLKDRRTSWAFDATLMLIHSFRMPLFFLLSGFFAALLFERYGMRRAYSNRIQRVLLPFVAGLVTVLPLAGWMIASFGVSVEAGARVLWTPSPPHLEWLRRLQAKIGGSGPGHLWFLYYLMMLYLLIPLCAAAQRALARPRGAAAMRRLSGSPWLPLGLAAFTAANLWPYKGAVVAGFQYFAPHVPSLVYYGTFFVVGYFVHGFRELLATCEKHFVAYAASSALVFVAALPLTLLDYRQGGAGGLLHLATVVLNGALTWVLICAAIGAFQRYFDRDSPWIAYISQSSYWVYLVHLPIVSFAAWALVDVDVPAAVKFLSAGVFTVVVAFATYHYLVRQTWVSVLLNGRRFSMRWPWLEPAGLVYSTSMGVVAPAVRDRESA